MEGAKKDRMCVIEDLDGESIEVLYSGLALELELHVSNSFIASSSKVLAKHNRSLGNVGLVRLLGTYIKSLAGPKEKNR